MRSYKSHCLGARATYDMSHSLEVFHVVLFGSGQVMTYCLEVLAFLVLLFGESNVLLFGRENTTVYS